MPESDIGDDEIREARMHHGPDSGWEKIVRAVRELRLTGKATLTEALDAAKVETHLYKQFLEQDMRIAQVQVVVGDNTVVRVDAPARLNNVKVTLSESRDALVRVYAISEVPGLERVPVIASTLNFAGSQPLTYEKSFAGGQKVILVIRRLQGDEFNVIVGIGTEAELHAIPIFPDKKKRQELVTKPANGRNPRAVIWAGALAAAAAITIAMIIFAVLYRPENSDLEIDERAVAPPRALASTLPSPPQDANPVPRPEIPNGSGFRNDGVREPPVQVTVFSDETTPVGIPQQQRVVKPHWSDRETTQLAHVDAQTVRLAQLKRFVIRTYSLRGIDQKTKTILERLIANAVARAQLILIPEGERTSRDGILYITYEDTGIDGGNFSFNLYDGRGDKIWQGVHPVNGESGSQNESLIAATSLLGNDLNKGVKEAQLAANIHSR